jgi:hypothetical protein
MPSDLIAGWFRSTSRLASAFALKLKSCCSAIELHHQKTFCYADYFSPFGDVSIEPCEAFIASKMGVNAGSGSKSN